MIRRNIFRELLGQRLAELRVQRGVSGRQLAPRLGVQQPALVKVERGKLIPSTQYLTKFARALKLSPAERDEIFTLADSLLHKTHRVQLGREGEFTRLQRLVSALDYRELRVFQMNLVPGPLQTEAYSRALFLTDPPDGKEQPRVEADLESALKERRKQTDRLSHAHRRFVFLIHENALRTRICPAKTMTSQLRHLVEVSRRKNVEIGLVPASHDYRVAQLEAPLNSFDLFDDALLTLDIYKGWLHFWSPDMISEYKTYFERLRSSALFGDALARAIEKIIRER
jgi:transcriptional regulator with XRE-family HTH domain